MRRRYLAAATAVLVTAGLGLPAAPAQAAPAKAPTFGHTITLITGDRVTVTGDRLLVRPAKGREHLQFSTFKRAGHLSVVPADALALVRTGRLDARLFDVTAQVGYGYDQRADLPLLVTPTGWSLAKPAVPAGLRVERNLPAVRGVAGRAAPADLGALWRDVKAHAATSKVWLDGVRKLDVSGVGQIGAPAAWQAGFDGTGVTVAVIDSGIDAAHPDLAGQVVAEHNFVSDLEDGLDHVGHGTHVASIIAGTGAASNGTYKGVAPGAKLIDAKACVTFGCPDSAILDAMNWVAADQHAKIVNMSLGGPDTPDVDPLEQAITDLSAQYGTLFVVAAGNDGADRTIESPGDVDAALTVGAVDQHDVLADFSSRGPRSGDSALKPDLTAPGVDITAALSKDSGGAGGPGGQPYIEHSGTSMATPHVAGAAAILLQHSPALTGPGLKATLMASAVPNPGTPVYGQGAGRVDVPRSLAAALTTSPASVSFGIQEWPHADDTVLTRTVTYHNSGNAAVTAGLALDTGGAPAGMFALSASTLTVPAGGDASVTVTADTRVTGPDGFFGGYVVASAGSSTSRTPFAVEKEVESYDVTINHVGAGGQPVESYFDTLIDLATGAFYAPFGEPGTDHVRLPKGRYFLDSTAFDGDLLVDQQQPVLDVSTAVTVTADTRTAKPITVSVPAAGAQQILAYVLAGFTIGTFAYGTGTFADTFDGLRIGPIGTSSLDSYMQQIGGQWAKPGDDSPFQYNLSFVQAKRPFAGLATSVQDRDLARVRSTYRGQLPGTPGVTVAFGSVPQIGFAISNGTVVHPPFTRDEFFSQAKDLTWVSQFIEQDPDQADGPFAFTSTTDSAYRAGHRYERVWGKAVIGPALPPGHVVRFGDEIVADLPLFSAAGPDLYGYSTVTGESKLFRNGVLVASGAPDLLDAPGLAAEPGRFRLETTAERSAPFTLSTKVSAVWEFRSGHTPEDQVTPLPLAAVRFSPWLDEHNTAPAGRLFVVPVSVPAPSAANRNRSLSVQVSYDDGATWKAAPVIAGVVVLNHPKGSGFVSLRARATDVQGNTVEETVLRAYKIE